MNTIFNPTEAAKNFNTTLCEILRVERELQGLIITDVCQPLNLQKSTYSKIENGKSNLSLVQFYDICSILKLEPQKIIEKAAKKAK